jgi:hypothetical protein
VVEEVVLVDVELDVLVVVEVGDTKAVVVVLEVLVDVVVGMLKVAIPLRLQSVREAVPARRQFFTVVDVVVVVSGTSSYTTASISQLSLSPE